MVVKPSIAGHGFEVGDMVWAKMKSQPWLPGHVYNEEFATPLVRRSKKEGLLLVAFFGASSYAWFDPSELLPFDSNYAEMCLQTDSNTFVRAVEDAIREMNRRIDLGLSCMCGNNKLNFREIDVQGFVSVDVVGYDPGAVYSIDVIRKARVSFQPKLTLDFLKELAFDPTASEDGDINFIKNKATVMSYRKAVYETFELAFGYDHVRASIQEPVLLEMSSKAPLSGREVKNTAKFKDHAKKDESKEIKVTPSPRPVPFKGPTTAAAELSTVCVEMSTSIVELSKKTGQPESDGNLKMEVSRLLDDLLSLAVDPFNIVNRGSRINGRKAFLRFRSLVFQKGRNFSLQLTAHELSSSKSSEDSVEVPLVKPLGGFKRDPSVRLEEKAAAKRKKVSEIRNLTKEKKVTKKIDELPVPACDLKPQTAGISMKKPASGEPNAGLLSEDRVEAPPVNSQSGLKRGLSDQNEEMAVARRKIVGDIKNLTNEKKVTKKIDESPARDMKQPVVKPLKKPGPELIKKTEQPTMLMIKFPKGGSLPSFKELKARFACYGPMDHSGTHIFWNTFSCQVLFRYRAHAQAAYRSVVESNSLFGNTDVKCTLKAVGIVGSAEPEPRDKVPKENHKQSNMEDRPGTMVPVKSGVERKSILKKPGCEEAADSVVGVRGRVKFELGQMKNNMETMTGPLAMHFSKNFQKAVDPSVTCTRGSSPPPAPPPPMHYGTPLKALESLPPRSMSMTTFRVSKPLNEPPLMTPNTDIAQQMLNLLARCNDVVTNVSSMLGYSPYHPL